MPSSSAQLNGQWIWHADSSVRHCVFRKTFNLNELPMSCELQWSSGGVTGLFLNGIPLASGCSSRPDGSFSIYATDLSTCLQAGRNELSLQVQVQPGGTYWSGVHQPRLWCQLLVDGHCLLATGRDTFEAAPDGSLGGMLPRRMKGCEPIEYADLRHDPLCASEEHPASWSTAFPGPAVDAAQFNADIQPAPALQETAADQICCRALGQRRRAGFQIGAGRLWSNPGTYVARCVFHLEQAVDENLMVLCDSAYKIFINAQLIATQGCDDYPNDVESSSIRPMSRMEHGDLKTRWPVQLRQGWNELSVVMHLGDGDPGLALNFSELSPVAVEPMLLPDLDSEHGWLLSGPLRVPIASILGPLSLDRLTFEPLQMVRIFDPAMHLLNYDFSLTDHKKAELNALPLSQGECITLDLGRIVSGHLKLNIEGLYGDQVDVVFTDDAGDGRPMPLQALCGRRAASITLCEGQNTWISRHPHGFRYAQVFVRHALVPITLQAAALLKGGGAPDSRTHFESSSAPLAKLWTLAANTLEACSEPHFLDSPSGKRGLFIRDAWSLGPASMLFSGDHHACRHALSAAALSQYETGEIPALSGSSYVLSISDYGLYWIDLLRHYLLLSDDRGLAKRLLPNLISVLDYYRGFEIADSGLLDGSLAHLSSAALEDAPADHALVCTSLNSLYIKALGSARWILDYLEQEEAAQQLTEQYQRCAASLVKQCWLPEQGLFADWSCGAVTGGTSLEANTMALACGAAALAGGNSLARHCQAVFSSDAASPLALEPAAGLSPLTVRWAIEAALNVNRRNLAYDILTWYWGSMAKDGMVNAPALYTPGEACDSSFNSMCAAAGSYPVGFLVQEAAGLRPAAPGFAQAYISPLVERLDWARVSLHTMHGPVKLEWVKAKDGSLSIMMNSNFPLEVIVELPPEYTDKTTFHVSEQISILQPE